jgi:hypothetical protein
VVGPPDPPSRGWEKGPSDRFVSTFPFRLGNPAFSPRVEERSSPILRLASLHKIIGPEHEVYVFGAGRIEFGAS